MEVAKTLDDTLKYVNVIHVYDLLFNKFESNGITHVCYLKKIYYLMSKFHIKQNVKQST